MWRNLRIATLLLVLGAVAIQAWLDVRQTRSWRNALWVGVFPINADGSAAATDYIHSLTPAEFTPVEDFFSREAHRYGVGLEQPVRVELYPECHELPPRLPAEPGPLDVLWWSLKLRWYAAHAADTGGRPAPRVRMFVLYHDPRILQTAPDSHGLEKGLLGVAHVFAGREMAGTNNIVLAHELMHILGATDKYASGTLAPLWPQGFAEPDQRPLYPQREAEIMAGRLAISEREFEMPAGLRQVVVGPASAREIRWTPH